MNISDKDLKIALEILGNLDDRGFLMTEPILIADRLEIKENDVIKIIKIIQHLTPPGIASLNMKECILAQLKVYYSEETFAYKIIENYWGRG